MVGRVGRCTQGEHTVAVAAISVELGRYQDVVPLYCFELDDHIAARTIPERSKLPS